MKEIEKLARECLNCKNPMCKKGCPVLTNIPYFIKCIKEKKMEEAYGVLQRNNIMSEICSKICPVEEQCVGNCIKGIKGDAVRINKLEELVNIWAKVNNIENKIEKQKPNNKKIAVVGGGPSGIACAVELCIMGYNVTIFEKEKKIGGILEYEIPDFRLEKNYVNVLEKNIGELGINVETSIEFGTNIDLDSLINKGFEAIFLGIGASIPKVYNLTNNECKDIFTANTILRKYHNKERLDNLGKVVVIGGGNVAMDVARTLKKEGNSAVTIVYRRAKKLMPANKEEIEEALNEGIDIIYNTRVINAIEDKTKSIKKVKCMKTTIIDDKAVDIPGSEHEIDANTVVFAIGLGIDKDFFNILNIEVENGLVKTDEFGMTNIKGIFAGGDLVEKKQTVCKAIASGKKAATGIDKYLKNGHF